MPIFDKSQQNYDLRTILGKSAIDQAISDGMSLYFQNSHILWDFKNSLRMKERYEYTQTVN